MIEATLTEWLSGLTAPLYAVVIPDDEKAPAIVYKIESEFTPKDSDGPYGAKGYRVRIVVWHGSYKSASEIAKAARDSLNIKRDGFLVSVEDRGDYQDADTKLYGVVIDVEVTELQIVAEPVQTGLRGAAKKLLLNQTDCGANVFASRIAFSNCNQFPCIRVSIDDVEIETGNGDQDRNAELEVKVKLPSSVSSENEIEKIVKQVEMLLHPDVQLLPESKTDIDRIDTEYSSVGRLCFDERRLEFSIQYYECFEQTDVVDKFDVANAGWNIDDDAAPEAKDSLTLPQD